MKPQKRKALKERIQKERVSERVPFFLRSEAGTDASEIGKERGRNGQAKIRGRFRSFSVPFSAKMGVKLEKD